MDQAEIALDTNMLFTPTKDSHRRMLTDITNYVREPPDGINGESDMLPLYQGSTGKRIGYVTSPGKQTPSAEHGNVRALKRRITAEDAEGEVPISEFAMVRRTPTPPTAITENQPTDAPMETENYAGEDGDQVQKSPYEMVEDCLLNALASMRVVSDHAEWPTSTVKAVELLYKKIKGQEPNEKKSERTDLNAVLTGLKSVTERLQKMEDRFNASSNRESDAPAANAPKPTTTQAKNVFASGPVFKPTPKLKHSRAAAAYHYTRLIIQLPKDLREEDRMEEQDIPKAINARLASTENSRHLQIVAAKYNLSGNCIINTRRDQNAEELNRFAHLFQDVLTAGGPVKTLVDKPWHKVQIDGVLARKHTGCKPFSSEDLLAELYMNNPETLKMSLTNPPYWMCAAFALETQTYSSVVISLDNEEDACTLLAQGDLAMFGRLCNIRKHADRPPVRQCNNCWQLGHSGRCPNATRCCICGEEHATDNHPRGRKQMMDGDNEPMLVDGDIAADYKCILCEGKHRSNSRTCPVRERAIGASREAESTAKAKSRRPPKPRKVKITTKDGFTQVGTAPPQKTAAIASSIQHASKDDLIQPLTEVTAR